MSTLTVQNIQGSASSSNTINVASGHTLVQPGMVLQVVNGPANAARLTSTSTSYVDTPITATITPKFATSKILVRFSTVGLAPGDVYLYLSLVRNIGGGSFSVINANEDHTAIGLYANAGAWGMLGHEVLDSPNTTSACIYKVQSKAASGTHYVGWSTNTDRKNMMNITLMEIAQ
jgi:hypothetical protein|tara:strand:+ start:222 stop:746 length:525 start_codon:yes stop_codon:yes gene_type:complete